MNPGVGKKTLKILGCRGFHTGAKIWANHREIFVSISTANRQIDEKTGNWRHDPLNLEKKNENREQRSLLNKKLLRSRVMLLVIFNCKTVLHELFGHFWCLKTSTKRNRSIQRT